MPPRPDVDRGSRHLRIALIASSFAPHVGGVEEHVAQVARSLAERGHAVEVWTVDREVRPEAPFGHGVTVRYLPTPLPARAPRALVRFSICGPRAWRQWTRAHRVLRPDALHIHCFGPNGLYGLALHRRFATPLIVTSHGETTGDDTSVFTRSALLRRGLRRALAAAAAVTAPSDYVLNDLRRRFGLRGGEVVVNGVRVDLPEAEPPVTGRYITTVRRLGRMKGVDLLVAAFAHARAAGRLDPDVRLVIAGDGPERERLQQQIRAAGLDGSVLLLGWLNPAQVAALASGAEAMVVPSRDEAFGIVALEAWRSGAPLIMTTRGGAAEFMTDGVDAVLVDPEDTEALASAIHRLLSNPPLRQRLADAGRARVAEFTWDGVADRYESVYERIAPSRADGR